MVAVAIASPVSYSGLPVTVSSAIDVDAPTPVSFFGLPVSVQTTANTPNLTAPPDPDAVTARVLDFAGNFICHLPDALGMRWLDEFNTAGSGSIDAYRYDDLETEHPGLWTAGNQVLVSVGGTDVFRIVLDSQGGYRVDDSGQQVDTWAGMGALGVLNSGMCIPEYGWRPEATEDRSFDYGSNPAVGGWYVGSEWHHPVGKVVRDSLRWTYKKRHLPKGMAAKKKAQWLWWRNPDSTSSANETCYFIGDPFTLSQPRRVKFWVAGDDTLEFQVDGETRITTGPGGWKKASTLVMNLSAGTHYVAAKVTNTPASSGNQNRSGFACAIGRINGDGDVVSWLRLSTPGTWKVRRQLGSPPGWFAGQILRQLVQEQKDRGCAGHSPVSFAFTSAADSHGVPWAGRQEISIPIGTQALDYVQQLVETGIDVAMSPGLTLQAWRTRGTDRSGWIKLDAGTAHAMEESAPQLPPIRNDAYARAATGWGGQSDAGSIAARGRRETIISLGSSRSPEQTNVALAAMLPDLANPPQTITVKFSDGPRPYVDFYPGDWISYRPAGASTRLRHRVMSIGGEVDDAGHPVWTYQLYRG